MTNLLILYDLLGVTKLIFHCKKINLQKVVLMRYIRSLCQKASAIMAMTMRSRVLESHHAFGINPFAPR